MSLRLLGLLGVPHALALGLCARYGFPVDGPAWYAPRRVAGLLRAVLSELGLVRLARRWWGWRALYRTTPLRVGPLDYGTPGRALDVYRRPGSVGRPVVVFLYGGAWGSGTRTLYAPLAQALVERGFAVVVPDYTLHPHGQVQAMLLDLRRVLAWVAVHAPEHGGDPSRVALLGHSAGAHLAALLTVRAALEGDSALLSQIRCVAGLAGVYDIGDHYLHEQGRGVESISPMRTVMGGSPEGFGAASPSALLEGRTSISGPPFLLVHGTGDATVPFRSSERFSEALRRAGWPLELRSYPGVGHLQLLLGLQGPEPFRERLLGELEDFLRGGEGPGPLPRRDLAPPLAL